MTEQQPDATASAIPNCPKCQGPMWDNRVGKKNPKAPDFKCKDRECDGVVWPPRNAVAGTATPAAGAAAAGSVAPGMPACPICGGPMWDDRTSKRNPKAPDFKCRNKPKERGGPGCEGVIWPPRDGSPSPYAASAPRRAATTGGRGGPPVDDAPFPNEPPPFDDAPPHDDDDLPF
jgi:transposase-like protein